MCRRGPMFARFPYATLFRSQVGVGAPHVLERRHLHDDQVGVLRRVGDLEDVARTDEHVEVALARQRPERSEEHTSELQSRRELVCRLQLEKKNELAPSWGAS